MRHPKTSKLHRFPIGMASPAHGSPPHKNIVLASFWHRLGIKLRPFPPKNKPQKHQIEVVWGSFWARQSTVELSKRGLGILISHWPPTAGAFTIPYLDSRPICAGEQKAANLRHLRTVNHYLTAFLPPRSPTLTCLPECSCQQRLTASTALRLPQGRSLA